MGYYLVEQGYTLYMVDYPARGRSTYIPGGEHGDLGIRTAEQLERIWTNVGEKGNFPLNDNHTQWPGDGHRGDPIFDNFIKTQVQFAGAARRWRATRRWSCSTRSVSRSFCSRILRAAASAGELPTADRIS